MNTQVSDGKMATQNLQQLTTAEHEAKVQEFTSGVDTSGLNLRKNFGKLFAIICGSDGKVLTETLPNGQVYPVLLVGETTWQFADAINAALKRTGGVKFMAWKWNENENSYIPGRTKRTPSGAQVGEEGVIDQFVRRHAGVKRADSNPVLSALDALRKAVAERYATTKDKEHKGVPPADTVSSVTRAYGRAMSELKADKNVVLKELHDTYPELFAK